MDRNFAALLWDAADRWPLDAAIEDAGEPTTYRDLRARASDVAAHLARLGVAPGSRVAVLLPRGAAAAAAIFGTLAAGGIVTVVNEESRPLQLAHICRTVGAAIIISSAEALTAERRQAIGDVGMLFIEDVPASPPSPVLDVRSETPAQIVFTSGSSGAPKGVLSSHANLWAGASCVSAYLGMCREDRVASLLSFAFVYGFNQLTIAMTVGATLVVERSALPPVLVGALARRAVTVIAAVPPLWQQLLGVAAFRDQRWESLRVVTNAGGHLAPAFVRALRSAQPGASLFLMYGMTEVFRSTFLAPAEVDAFPDSIGRAVPGSRVNVIRDDGTECAVGEVGELVHSGPTVALGYWNDPESTMKVFRDHPLSSAKVRAVYTGDLARRDAEGRLFHCGRRDAVIKTLGFRVSPDEISDVIFSSAQVAECAVHGVEDPMRGQVIVAHLVLNPEGTLDGVRAIIGRELPRHMHPSRMIEHQSLPRTPNGKIDLPALKALVASPSPR
jgi:amino acid adenylation domain-containing protein